MPGNPEETRHNHGLCSSSPLALRLRWMGTPAMCTLSDFAFPCFKERAVLSEDLVWVVSTLPVLIQVPRMTTCMCNSRFCLYLFTPSVYESVDLYKGSYSGYICAFFVTAHANRL